MAATSKKKKHFDALDWWTGLTIVGLLLSMPAHYDSWTGIPALSAFFYILLTSLRDED